MAEAYRRQQTKGPVAEETPASEVGAGADAGGSQDHPNARHQEDRPSVLPVGI